MSAAGPELVPTKIVQQRYLCVHGHFYQPPRENPWLETVERQDSAAPFHDWNDRITSECYGPNTAARICGADGRIAELRNNLALISFNFGPTLLHWMERMRPDVYEGVIAADRQSVRERSGHGNSLAQCYNHVIMPLATPREKLVQVEWGLEDFRERFGRDPEGMWLPECGVDAASLEALAEAGIKFTVLAPRQARRVRPDRRGAEWHSVEGSRIDPTRPYHIELPSGRTMAIFFYDGPISQAIAFEGLLHDGAHFAARMMQGFSATRPWPQLLSIGTDGESYGHHHRQGEMALAYALHMIERDQHAILTNFGEYLAKHPPTAEVQLWQKSSWSCVHGVERWKTNCGCNSGMQPNWQQGWRAPLRDAFRLLANAADELFDSQGSRLFRDPKAALLNYITVILNDHGAAAQEFLHRHARNVESATEQTRALQLMEIMRHAQLIFTSCAWFFDDVSGLEGVQNMRYAARLIQLLQGFEVDVERGFLAHLEKAPSNIPELRNGAECYRRWVAPQAIDAQRLAAHQLMMRFDDPVEGTVVLFSHELHERENLVSHCGPVRLRLCRVSVRSRVDFSHADFTALVMHFGGGDFRCSIAAAMSQQAYAELRSSLTRSCQEGSITGLVRLADEVFGRQFYNINHLFAEGKRELLLRLTATSFEGFEETLERSFEENRRFMDYLLEVGTPLPSAFTAAADVVLKRRLLEELARFDESLNATTLVSLAHDANRYRVRMDDPVVRQRASDCARRLFDDLALHPDPKRCRTALAFLEVIDLLALNIDLWEAQNIVFALQHGRAFHPGTRQRLPGLPAQSEVHALVTLRLLADRLRVAHEALPPRSPGAAARPTRDHREIIPSGDAHPLHTTHALD